MEALLIKWLEKRIEKTKMEKEMAVELNNMNLVLSKGGKLTAYKGMLDYVKTHKDDSI
jgi:hypothetical protein